MYIQLKYEKKKMLARMKSMVYLPASAYPRTRKSTLTIMINMCLRATIFVYCKQNEIKQRYTEHNR